MLLCNARKILRNYNQMKKIILLLSVVAINAMAVGVGKVPAKVTLSGKNGGTVSGKTWSSSSLKGKVHIVFYVDPDKKDLNNNLAEALKAAHFNRSKFASVAIINLAATWLPNSILSSKLKDKQKKYPDTLYVLDKKKVLVEKWKVADDNSDILVFDKKGKLIYKKFGKTSGAEIKKILALVKKNM